LNFFPVDWILLFKHPRIKKAEQPLTPNLKTIMIVDLLGTFGSKLLSLFLMSAFHSFLSKCLCYRKDKQW